MNRDEEIFTAAVLLRREERAAFLDRACGDDAALRARVAALLISNDEAEVFFADQAVSRPAVLPEEKPGERIGRYKLLQKIGEGGCGVVYMAEQEEPVRRRVALKVIKLGMDTKEVIARFEAERQALALMDHPNIARVLDGGATETGRPFFVMELVRGVPITKFCDEQNLSATARLELFTQVCLAVQHAHQKGIIHRDIKPSNVLVELHDTRAVPKMIDFGIAKATEGRLTDATLFTAFDQFIGTPAYMSPEQAQLSGLDIDTRSDVYSLGVLLYELLTGRTPFETKELLHAGFDEIRRQIREVEPPKPSTRLRTLEGEALTATAAHRQTAPFKLINFIRGDLDWIVMRCLEKDRTRRYESANALAVDLQHLVRDEPVSARPPSAWYVLGKLARRHRAAVMGAGGFLFLVAGGTGVSAWQISSERTRNASNAAEEAVVKRGRTAAEAGSYLVPTRSWPVKHEGEFTYREVVQAAAAGFPKVFGENSAVLTKVEFTARDLVAMAFIAQGDFAAAQAQVERALAVARHLVAQTPRASGVDHRWRVRDGLLRMVQLYRAWDAAEPNTGKAALADDWQRQLAKFERAYPDISDRAHRQL